MKHKIESIAWAVTGIMFLVAILLSYSDLKAADVPDKYVPVMVMCKDPVYHLDVMQEKDEGLRYSKGQAYLASGDCVMSPKALYLKIEPTVVHTWLDEGIVFIVYQLALDPKHPDKQKWYVAVYKAASIT